MELMHLSVLVLVCWCTQRDLRLGVGFTLRAIVSDLPLNYGNVNLSRDIPHMPCAG